MQRTLDQPPTARRIPAAMPACRQIGFVLTGRKVLAVLMTLMIVGAAIAALPTRAGDVAPAVLDAQQHRIDVMRRASAAADGPASSRRSLCWTAGSPRHSTDGSRYPQKPIAANLSVRNDGNAEDAEGGDAPVPTRSARL